MKRILLILAGAVLVLVVAGSVALFLLVSKAGQKGSGTIEAWVGGEIQGVCSWYLKPKVSFDDLDYQYPGTVLLKNFRMAAEDPGHPGKRVDILAARGVRVELAQVPRIGRRVKIERIILDHPLVRVVAVEGDSHRFVGFSDLLRAPAKGESGPGGGKISDLFQMRQVELIGGRVIYDPRRADQPPMELDDIQTRLDIAPTGDGWYGMHTTLRRAPSLDAAVGGQLNLDTFDVRGLDLSLNTQLDPAREQYLPPQLQTFLKKHAVQGNLEITLSGGLPVFDFRGGNLQALVKLRQARVEVGQYNLALDWMRLKARLADGKVVVDSMDLTALGGNASLKGMMALTDPLDTQLKLTASRMTLDDLLRTPAGERPAFGGRINVQLYADAPMAAVLAQLTAGGGTAARSMPALSNHWGEGFIELDHGRLMDLPAIKQLARAMGDAHADRAEDQALAIFTLSGNKIRFGRIAVAGSWFAVRGAGTIGLNQRLDLTLNGGPLEKVESLFGEDAGRALGRVTDSLASYNVRGTIDDPQIGMRAGSRNLDSGFRKTGEDIGRKFRGLFGN
jgi:hypothetical protein